MWGGFEEAHPVLMEVGRGSEAIRRSSLYASFRSALIVDLEAETSQIGVRWGELLL